MMSGPYPEHCSYQLTAMCTQKNVPKKTKSSESNMLTSKKEVYETFEVFLVDKSSTRKMEENFQLQILSLHFSFLCSSLFFRPQNTVAQKPLDKLMQ